MYFRLRIFFLLDIPGANLLTYLIIISFFFWKFGHIFSFSWPLSSICITSSLHAVLTSYSSSSPIWLYLCIYVLGNNLALFKNSSLGGGGLCGYFYEVMYFFFSFVLSFLVQIRPTRISITSDLFVECFLDYNFFLI